MLTIPGAAAVLVAAFVKGAIGFGFPTLATPLLALVTDVKMAVVALIIPNIVMDTLQFVRQGPSVAVARRLIVLLVFGAVGTVLGTHLLVVLPARVATLILGGVLMLFVALNLARVAPRVPAGWESRLAPVVGLATGLVGGVTNVPGTPLVMWFFALGMDKPDFVRSVALSFVVYKVVQLGAVAYYGLLSATVLWMSVALTAVALAGFALGLAVQDRLDQRTFNRAILTFLGALGLWLTLRTLW
ncbi:MAG TPA: sulfite exporter TauE/SafE family protein [Methylomirabilota bacterium]